MGKHIARKRFGQHFLSDHSVIDQLVKTIAPQNGQAMIEIGPGLGALTRPLLEHLEQMTVIELDRDLVTRLQKNPKLNVIEADVLTVDFAPLASANGVDTKLRVVGNLPYNISTPILFHLLQYAHVIEDQHFMLQKEVVDRMVASPATAQYGRLSVMLQWCYHMESVFDIPPTAFDPPPKVISSIVAMTPFKSVSFQNTVLLEELVKVAFSQRRKLLRHTLGKWLEAHAYTGCFDLQRRAEEVPVADYLALACEVS
ncbi:MAG: 16S rRNA (adenine(1518)-N(6)/adenine(1519)-N(6))-dimethyltransferase RsmA [Saezia sp.]